MRRAISPRLAIRRVARGVTWAAVGVLLLEEVEAVMLRVDWRKARGTGVRPRRWVVRLRERISSDQISECCGCVSLTVGKGGREEMNMHNVLEAILDPIALGIATYPRLGIAWLTRLSSAASKPKGYKGSNVTH